MCRIETFPLYLLKLKKSIVINFLIRIDYEKSTFAQFVIGVYDSRKKVIQKVESRLELHSKIFQKIGFALFVE